MRQNGMTLVTVGGATRYRLSAVVGSGSVLQLTVGLKVGVHCDRCNAVSHDAINRTDSSAVIISLNRTDT